MSSTPMADISNGVLYGLFTVSALLGGTMINTFGPRITMMFGVTGYPIYIGGLWYFDVYGKLWFPVLAGAYLGITAGCLWSVAGTISFPPIQGFTDNFRIHGQCLRRRVAKGNLACNSMVMQRLRSYNRWAGGSRYKPAHHIRERATLRLHNLHRPSDLFCELRGSYATSQVPSS